MDSFLSETRLISPRDAFIVRVMGLANEAVTLTAQQVEELNQKLSRMRHDINNHLSLIIFAVEVLRSKPEMIERMTNTLSDQTPKITASMMQFSTEFEQALGVAHY